MKRALSYLPVTLQVALCVLLLVGLILLRWSEATLADLVNWIGEL